MANLVRLEPAREMLSLREAMDRLFEESFLRPGSLGVSDSPSAMLPMDMYETENDVVVKAAIPGVKPEDVEITIEGDTLTIRGERPAPIENVNYVMQERTFGKFQRTLNINIPVDSNRAEARYENGLLTLVIPKAEAAKPKVIQVTTKQA